MAVPSNLTDRDANPVNATPGGSAVWLTMIREAERTLDDYQRKADNVDDLYANLNKLSNNARDREFQLFWANIQVMGPSIYSRPPQPVVVPRFKDRRPLYRQASELLERCVTVSFETADIDGLMLLLRDDLTIAGRGVARVRYEARMNGNQAEERLHYDHIDRRDYISEPARKWADVGWVAYRAWMTRDEMRERFGETSGDAYLEVELETRRDDSEKAGQGRQQKGGVWEIWHKGLNRCVWVAEGCEVTLDEAEPHLKLEGFFPSPRPAYATLQRRTMIPVPDVVYYRDQLDEVNELTGRIHALSESIKVKGFYPAGASEIGDAVENALKTVDNRQVLVPISNWAAFGQSGDTIIWLPIDQIAQTVVALVELRKSVIDDVYQIMGLSDIMRGSTVASETLGAQELKSQYGSIRIRDKQAELVRMARDLVRITAEIMAENFQPDTLLAMSQLEIETDEQIAQKAQQIQQQAAQQLQAQVQQAMASPEAQQAAQQDPNAAQQMMQQAQSQMQQQVQQQIAQLQQVPTLEKVVAFLRDQRVRPFVLDIETDSTIAPDEDAAKQRATEYVTAVGGFMGQALPLLQADPSAAGVIADTLRYVASQFRAGRQMEASIEEFADQMKARASQPQQESPEAQAAKAEAEAKQQEAQSRQQEMQGRLQMEAQKAQADMALKQADLQSKQFDAQARQAEVSGKLEIIAAERDAQVMRHGQEMQKGELELRKLALDIEAKASAADNAQRMSDARMNEMASRSQENGAA
jgi:hypothetical protein